MFKVTLLLLVLNVSQAGAEVFAQKATINAKNMPMKEVFLELRKQTGYHFMYLSEDLKIANPVNIQATNISIKSILKICFADQPLTYEIRNNRVLVGRKSVWPQPIAGNVPEHLVKPPVTEEAAQGITEHKMTEFESIAVKTQDREIRGRVTDEAGEGMIGVTVGVKGTSVIAKTNDAGNYQIVVPDNGNILVFTAIGYETREMPIGASSSINMIMKESVTAMNEVVVVGYGTQKKTSVTAAVSSIQGQTISKLPVANISNALGGRVPGLITRQGSGQPGDDGATMYIRGIGTRGSTSPLLVVDGVPRSFTQLDPETIETISVLKDAAASAPYGVAGANGVILVTTKQGKMGAPTLTYTSSFGVQNPSILPEYPTSYEFALMKNAASLNEKPNPLPPPYSAADLQKFQDGSDPDRFANQNPNDLITRNVPLINNSLQLSGGADRVKYFASAGYLFQQGIFEPIKSNRYTLSLNLDGEVTKSTTVSLKLNGRQTDNSYAGVAVGSIFTFLNYALPTQPVKWSNGENATYIWPMIYESGSSTDRNTQIFSQLSINQKLNFLPGLSARAQIAYDPGFNFGKDWVTPTHVWAPNFNTTPYTFTDAIYGATQSSLSQSYSNPRNLTYQAGLNYVRTFGKSNISALGLFEARQTRSMSFGASRQRYNLDVDELSLGSPNSADISNSGSSSEGRQMGLVYRVTYDFAGKYLFEATGRYDGHYYFAPGKRFGFFPAVSAGWRLSEENFIKKNVPWISNLKLRGSYGEVGALAGGAFQFLSSYGVATNAAVINGIAVQGINESAEPNREITWERAKKTNVAFEASFWRDLLTVEAEYFSEMRSNMLFAPTVTVPQEYGIGLRQVNAGRVRNQGYEVTIGSRYRANSNLMFTLSANITRARNKQLEIFETAATYNNPNRRQTGRSIGTVFGYDAVGFYLPEDFTDPNAGVLKPTVQTSPANVKVYPGDLKYRDLNGDLKINTDDIVPIGDSQVPTIMYGINPGITFKAFRLDVLMQGTMKRNFYASDWAVWPFNVGRGAYKHNLDYWRPDNLDARNPRITNAPAANNTVTSSWWMNDASYLRIKNVQLGYSLPKNLISKIGLANATLNLTAQNLATFSNMKYDYDPENAANLGAYPPEQVISMGLNVTFK